MLLSLLRYCLLLFAVSCLPLLGLAQTDTEQDGAGLAEQVLIFNDETTRQRYYQLIDELRCPKCQNQNLADSDAPIAADLRERLYQQLQLGKTDSEILDYMTSRYGTFVLYKPPLNIRTLVLWLLPILALAGGIAAIITLSRRTQHSSQSGMDEQPQRDQAAVANENNQLKIERLRQQLQSSSQPAKPAGNHSQAGEKQ